MKAAVVQRPEVVETCEVERPLPAPGEVLVRVAYCGVCGSDVPRVWMGTAHSYPIVLGHEFSGEVVEVGDGADDALVGQRVVGVPLVPCHECSDCAAGDFSLCKHYSFIGSRRPGAFAEYVAVPAQNVFPLPDGVSYLNGAFLSRLQWLCMPCVCWDGCSGGAATLQVRLRWPPRFARCRFAQVNRRLPRKVFRIQGGAKGKS